MSDDELLIAYRHDAHKMLARPHHAKSSDLAELMGDLPVPLGADGDASSMSRPANEPTVTVKNHADRFRLSLLADGVRTDRESFRLDKDDSTFVDLFWRDDAEATHLAWLNSNVAGRFNESVYYPYTSLKYHTLLVAALLDNYQDGTAFSNLALAVDLPAAVTPFRTIYMGDRFSLRIDAESETTDSARLGSRPWRSWASTWSRLPVHPLDTDGDRFDMVLDAQLRRIWSWSTALQYIEDFAAWRANR